MPKYVIPHLEFYESFAVKLDQYDLYDMLPKIVELFKTAFEDDKMVAENTQFDNDAFELALDSFFCTLKIDKLLQ